MKAEQIELIQETFLQLRRQADTVATLFYEHLFAENPALRSLFQGDMLEQGRKLMNLLGVVVVGLPQLDRMAPMLRELGARHASYGVEEKHYDAVLQALVWTLEQSLREDFTPPVRQAWLDAYAAMSSVMHVGAREAGIHPARAA